MANEYVLVDEPSVDDVPLASVGNEIDEEDCGGGTVPVDGGDDEPEDIVSPLEGEAVEPTSEPGEDSPVPVAVDGEDSVKKSARDEDEEPPVPVLIGNDELCEVHPSLDQVDVVLITGTGYRVVTMVVAEGTIVSVQPEYPEPGSHCAHAQEKYQEARDMVALAVNDCGSESLTVTKALVHFLSLQNIISICRVEERIGERTHKARNCVHILRLRRSLYRGGNLEKHRTNRYNHLRSCFSQRTALRSGIRRPVIRQRTG